MRNKVKHKIQVSIEKGFALFFLDDKMLWNTTKPSVLSLLFQLNFLPQWNITHTTTSISSPSCTSPSFLGLTEISFSSIQGGSKKQVSLFFNESSSSQKSFPFSIDPASAPYVSCFSIFLLTSSFRSNFYPNFFFWRFALCHYHLIQTKLVNFFDFDLITI